MCGICGVINFDPTCPVNLRLLESMTDSIRHRGPDDVGYLLVDRKSKHFHTWKGSCCNTSYFGSIGLGHRRLSIIDLETGHQPLANEDESIWIVFNGEIYNFKALRAYCIARGHRFRTHTDTEVLIHLYEEKGLDCLTDLEGMFAFALWDARSDRLIIARDRLGQKPLYYTVDSERLIFASEMKAILQDPTVPREIDIAGLHHYLTFMSVPAPFTILKKIRKLEPGHFICLRGDKLQIQPYWDLDFEKPASSKHLSKKKAVALLQEHLHMAVQKRMVSDVPLGAFLSGGIDSSAIVASMSQFSDEPIKTFSIGFGGDSYYNELNAARLVAKQFGTDHHEYVVHPEIRDLLPKLIWHWDEPFAVSSAIPTYYLSKMARSEVTVVLTGDGGDEQFAGYNRYIWDQWADRLSWLPGGFKKGMSLFLRPVPDSVASSGPNFVRKVKRYLDSLALDPDSRYMSYFTFFNELEKRKLYSNDFHAEVDGLFSVDVLKAHYRQFKGRNRLDRRLYGDIKTTLPDEMLTKVDRMSMAVGLEARSPFLDHKLMAFVAGLPSDWKLKSNQTKAILKEALTDRLPRDIIYRKKHGFEVPIDDWLRGPLKPFMDEILSESTLREQNFFNVKYVKQVVDDHMAHRRNLGHHLWILLIFGLWYSIFITGETAV